MEIIFNTCKLLEKKIKQTSFFLLADSNFGTTFVLGEVAEWSIAAVLKTVEGQTSGGSNPSLSADHNIKAQQNPVNRMVYRALYFYPFYYFTPISKYRDTYSVNSSFSAPNR